MIYINAGPFVSCGMKRELSTQSGTAQRVFGKFRGKTGLIFGLLKGGNLQEIFSWLWE